MNIQRTIPKPTCLRTICSHQKLSSLSLHIDRAGTKGMHRLFSYLPNGHLRMGPTIASVYQHPHSSSRHQHTCRSGSRSKSNSYWLVDLDRHVLNCNNVRILENLLSSSSFRMSPLRTTRFWVLSSRNFHTSISLERKKKAEISSEPIKFTTSAANIKAMPDVKTLNPYEPISVFLSLFVFLLYFLYLREENDLDDHMNTHLFERIPNLEEPTIRQAIPQMRDMGMDTREAEARLKELVQERMERDGKGK